MEPLAGVEKNESSRFIDHTVATPWESLILDLEQAFRSCPSLPDQLDRHASYISYNNINFKLQALELPRHGASGAALPWTQQFFTSVSPTTPPLRFIFLLSPINSLTNEKHLLASIESAFFIAWQAVNTQLTMPCFFSSLPINQNTDLLRTTYLRGYCSQMPQDSTTQGMQQYLYESLKFSALHPKHVLFFFDGIRKLYSKKAKSALCQGLAIDPERFSTRSVSFFDYSLAQWQQAFSDVPMDDELRSPTAPTPVLPSFAASLTNYLPTLHWSHLKYAKIQTIQVQLLFLEHRPHSIIDNETYSSFVPSKQPPGHWRLLPLQQSPASTETVTVHSNAGQYWLWRSAALSSLLAQFVLQALLQSIYSIDAEHGGEREQRGQEAAEMLIASLSSSAQAQVRLLGKAVDFSTLPLPPTPTAATPPVLDSAALFAALQHWLRLANGQKEGKLAAVAFSCLFLRYGADPAMVMDTLLLWLQYVFKAAVDMDEAIDTVAIQEDTPCFCQLVQQVQESQAMVKHYPLPELLCDLLSLSVRFALRLLHEDILTLHGEYAADLLPWQRYAQVDHDINDLLPRCGPLWSMPSDQRFAQLEQTIRGLDAVLVEMEALETLVVQFHQVAPLLQPVVMRMESRQMMQQRLWRCVAEDGMQLETLAERQTLINVMKSIHIQEIGGHGWYSYDGRELGTPSAKSFLLRSVGEEDAGTREGQEKELVMFAVVDQQELRVNFRIPLS